jgi:hypothetical protein
VIEGFDACLVHQIQLPNVSLRRNVFDSASEETFSFGDLDVGFYETQDMSSCKFFIEHIKSGNKELNVVVKFISPVGETVETWDMKCTVAAVYPWMLKYDSSDPFKGQASFTVLSVDINDGN